MSDRERACRWFVSGRVQGVGFRWFAQRAAEECGVVGWVRNLPDGRVEAVAKGDPESLMAFEEALTRGPRLSHVENVDKVDVEVDVVSDKFFHVK